MVHVLGVLWIFHIWFLLLTTVPRLIYHTHCSSFTVTGTRPWQVRNAHYSSTLLVMTWGLSLAIKNVNAMNSLITVFRDTFPCISLGLSVQFSHLVGSDSLRPHGLQHTRPCCPSPTPRAFIKLMSIELVMPSNHLILCRPLCLLPSIFPSIRVFSNDSVLRIRWPKYSASAEWVSASASVLPMNIQDWFPLG